MKIAVIATAVALTAASSASAMDLGSTGISLGAELDTAYNVDQENMNITLTPELGYSRWGAAFTLGADIALYDDGFVAGDVLPTIDFGASYGLELYGIESEIYLKTSYDLEASDRGDLTIGTTFKF